MMIVENYFLTNRSNRLFYFMAIVVLFCLTISSCHKKRNTEVYPEAVPAKGISTPIVEPLNADQNLNDFIQNTKLVTMEANYVKEGIIKGYGVQIHQEMFFDNGHKIKEVIESGSGKMMVRIETMYDLKNRITELRSFVGNEKSVVQLDTYNGDRLEKEFRLEYNEDKVDTIIYRYLYPEKETNPLRYYRTNNEDTVTVLVSTKKGLTETVEEKSFTTENKSIRSKVRDQRGNVLEEEFYTIGESWENDGTIVTSKPVKTIMEFDQNNNVILKKELLDNKVTTITKMEYRNGVIERMYISQNGSAPITVNFQMKKE